MTIKLSAAELTHVVTAVPGVRGIEPGIGSTLKAIGSRMSGDPAAARFGIIIESGGPKVLIEIGIDNSRAVKEIVRNVQEAVLRSLSQANLNLEGGALGSASKPRPQVRVRVQSLL
ncbi:hypothetical protein HMPREF0742_01014 [Rothia aeria F0184]|uniref:Uncharacterized protein n=2 Tax=Rothia aeria TaxID=172042 RepID=U7V4C5_9MICC|nr:hypothetical protein [Rothia aeria]EID50766.1 hypothetical protein HMPREF1324_0156 [Rothia aeria F0474]ERT66361.1 hypothetical protein HMPREF0742_01014 [Rothia aeria F0184]